MLEFARAWFAVVVDRCWNETSTTQFVRPGVLSLVCDIIPQEVYHLAGISCSVFFPHTVSVGFVEQSKKRLTEKSKEKLHIEEF